MKCQMCCMEAEKLKLLCKDCYKKMQSSITSGYSYNENTKNWIRRNNEM